MACRLKRIKKQQKVKIIDIGRHVQLHKYIIHLLALYLIQMLGGGVGTKNSVLGPKLEY